MSLKISRPFFVLSAGLGVSLSCTTRVIRASYMSLRKLSPLLVMLAFQRTIDGALGNNSGRHEYISKLTRLVALVDSTHHCTLFLWKRPKKGTLSRYFFWFSAFSKVMMTYAG